MFASNDVEYLKFFQILPDGRLQLEAMKQICNSVVYQR